MVRVSLMAIRRVNWFVRSKPNRETAGRGFEGGDRFRHGLETQSHASGW